RRVQRLAFNVPKSHVNRGDGCHGYGATTPIGPAIEVLPDIFRLERLPAIQRAVAQPINASIGFYLQCDEVSSRRSYVYRCPCDLHSFTYAHLSELLQRNPEVPVRRRSARLQPSTYRQAAA